MPQQNVSDAVEMQPGRTLSPLASAWLALGHIGDAAKPIGRGRKERRSGTVLRPLATGGQVEVVLCPDLSARLHSAVLPAARATIDVAQGRDLRLGLAVGFRNCCKILEIPKPESADDSNRPKAAVGGGQLPVKSSPHSFPIDDGLSLKADMFRWSEAFMRVAIQCACYIYQVIIG